MAGKETITDEWTEYYSEHTNKDYPVGVYYIDLSKMFMNGVRLHWHNEIEIDYVRSGEAIYHMGEEEIHVKAGSAILINQGRIHSISNAGSTNCIILSLLFSPDFILESNNQFLSAKYKEPVTSSHTKGYILFTDDTRNGRSEIANINNIIKVNLDKSFGYELKTRGHLCNFWLDCMPHMVSTKNNKISTLTIIDEERVKEAIYYINNHYQNAITLEEIADYVHLSKSECCRCFKRATNMTPFEYLMSHRIFISARKMQRNDEICSSIAALSLSVGFNNASYYNKIFKQFTGETPTKSREILKKSHRDALSPFGISLSRM